MDHFCPWVGGVVSETSWKFFIQFVCYTFLLCGTVIILFAILLAENVRQGGQINVHFVVALSL
jgi:palmitoyltransferase